MFVSELKQEDIKIGIKVFYDRGSYWGGPRCGVITYVDRDVMRTKIIITWDNGDETDLINYNFYDLTHVIEDCFFISWGKK